MKKRSGVSPAVTTLPAVAKRKQGYLRSLSYLERPKMESIFRFGEKLRGSFPS
jgi:hypothetical protein